MMFWFKKKEIVLDCFTSNSSVFEFAKPDHAIKFLPEWWKNAPSTFIKDDDFFRSSTIKKCAGMTDLYTHGVVLPMWCDVALELAPIGETDYRWQFSDQRSRIETHDFRQLNNCIDAKEFLHAKLISPWLFKSNDPAMWTWNTLGWNTLGKNDYFLFPGMLEYKHQYSTNINLLFKREKEKRVVEIPFREPLVHLIPLTDKKLVIKHHLISVFEYSKLNDYLIPVTFSGKYRAMKRCLGK